MRFRRCPYWLLTALCLVALGTGGQNLLAQEKLSPTILGATAELSEEDQATVDQFLDTQVARLQSDDPADVAKGRARIAEQIPLSTSESFLTYYRQALASRVTPLIQPDSPLMTRLNVVILSENLVGDSLVNVLEASADDPSPAVRYWIAKAVGAAAKDDAFNEQQQRDVLAVLADRLKAEDSSLVLAQILLALAEIELPEAVTTILEGLDARVNFHAKNPDARFKPVLEGMQQLWSKLIAQRSGGTSTSNVNKNINDLARSDFRFYALIADQMPALEAPVTEEDEDIKKDKALMAQLCARVMAYAADVAGVTAPQPVDTNNATELRVSTDRWREVLKASPFNFTDEDLAVGE